MPAGRPVADQVYGAVPPEAVRVTGPYAVPGAPPGRLEGVIVIPPEVTIPGAMVTE
jgi:hypothetical protein